jgi:ABC-type transporter Mla MlaB component
MRGEDEMLKIERKDGDDGGLVFGLAGELRGPWVDELGRVVQDALDARTAGRLDLADVSFVDCHGVVLLNRLADRDVTLVNCSSFVTELPKLPI